MTNMGTKVTRRWQTVVPAVIRQHYQIKEGDTLVWLDDGQTIRIVPVPSDPLKALRGRGKGEGLTKKLLESRREVREHEQR
jgi:AbrB family looped-hinge helix DNA binding protein